MRKLLLVCLLVGTPAFGASPSLLPAIGQGEYLPKHTCRYIRETEQARIACNTPTIYELLQALAVAQPKLWKPYRIKPGSCGPRFGTAVVNPRNIGGVIGLLREHGWRVEREGYPATVVVQCW